MPDIPISSNFQLNQALNQLSQAAPDSAVARQAMDVIIKHLDGNIMSLTPNTGNLLKSALLNKNNLQGQLNNGERYQIKLSGANTPVIEFFNQQGASVEKQFPLTESLRQMILKLPAQQLAQIISLSTKEHTNSAKLITNLVPLEATLLSQNNKQVTIRLDSSKPAQTINFPSSRALSGSNGEKLNIELFAKGQNWQLELSYPNRTSLTSSRPNTALELATNQRNNSTNSRIDKLVLAPESASILIKESLVQLASKQALELDLPLQNIIAQLKQAPVAESLALLKQIRALDAEKIGLQIKQNGDFSLSIKHSTPVASLALTAENMSALKVLNLKELVKLSAQISNDEHLSTKANPPLTQVNLTSKVRSDQANPNLTASNNVPARPAASPLQNSPDIGNTATREHSPTALIRTSSAAPDAPATGASLLTDKILNNKSEQLALIQSLLRISQPKADLPSQVISTIDRISLDPTTAKVLSEPDTLNWLKEVNKEIKNALPMGNETDAKQIKQLLSTVPLPVSSVQIVSPPAAQGLLSGLITLLQVSLTARLMRNQPSQAERIAQILPSIFTEGAKTDDTGMSKANPLKSMLEFNQLEQKHQLMREIGKLLADHQSNKLNNAERLLQGQDTFYYNLPSAFNGEFRNVELLIKREEEKAKDDEQQQDRNKNWQLTMKLTVGEIGELLTKAKLQASIVEIDFYASNDEVLHKVMNYLPLLKKRLVNLGIEVSKSQCQLGKIPDTLEQRPYHIFTAKA